MSTAGLLAAARELTKHRPRTFGLFVLIFVLNAGMCALALALRGAWVFPFQFGIFCCSATIIVGSLAVGGGDLLHGEPLFRWKAGERIVCWRPVVRLVAVLSLVYGVVLGIFFALAPAWHFFFCLGMAVYGLSIIMLRFWFDWRSAPGL